MASSELNIPITLIDGSKTNFTVFAESINVNSLRLINESEASEYGEAPLQLLEGYSYEYSISGNYIIQEIPKVVNTFRTNKSAGRITPNIYVGTLQLEIIDKETSEKKGVIPVEVRSVKTSYRQDYRFMLEDITEKCTELLIQHSSPVTQHFAPDFNRNPQTLYQRFAFVKSLIDSSDFKEAVHRIVSYPVTTWSNSEEEKDIRRVKRINNSVSRQIASGSCRLKIPESHNLHNRLESLPAKLTLKNKRETVNTPENRFIKHALVTFSQFCADIRTHLNTKDRAYLEARQLEEVLENFLSHSIFKEVSPPASLNLNSPVLQRKEGYREVLRAWLMFDLAAKLVWNGGDDVYSAGKRDVAVLYEYWLFFTLLDILRDLFKIEPSSIDNLIEQTSDGLGLILKSGRYTPLKGIYDTGKRKLKIKFCFNRTFSGDKDYPAGGSWTKNMRPDYTLSVWPAGITEADAEVQELITHIHFDAKYKIENLAEIVGNDEDDLEEEKLEQKQGNYKRADLLKMHAYKDAIRRTAGAYVLYPGSEKLQKAGFHELIPGLGAFPVRPSRNDNGIKELKEFIIKVIDHLLNKASQREQLSYNTYYIHKNQDGELLQEPVPEKYENERTPPPNEIKILVGYYKDIQHYSWIERSKLYNARMDTSKGSLRLGPAETGAKYLLLHTKGQLITGNIWRITGKGPRVFSKEAMIKNNYPNPSQNYYLIYEVEKVNPEEFANAKWDIRKLEKHNSGRSSALPFAVSLTELMKVKV